jgi:hypothetical protein
MEETIYVQNYWMENPYTRATTVFTYNEKDAYKFNKNDRGIIRKAMNHVIFSWWNLKHKPIAKPQVIPIGT